MPPTTLRIGPWRLRCPILMGIVNLTPDSFSDGGRYVTPPQAVAHARKLVRNGAKILDFGPESTRPGFAPVDAQEQRRRLMPALKAVVSLRLPVAISIDTRLASIAEEALALGAHVLNDVSETTQPDMALLAQRNRCPLVVMHNSAPMPTASPSDTDGSSVAHPAPQGVFPPSPHSYADNVYKTLRARAEALMAQDFAAENIWLDPGLGFGKSAQDNWALTAALDQLTQGPYPVFYGASRKRFVRALRPIHNATVLDDDVASAMVSGFAARAGASILRVHAPRYTAAALRVAGELLTHRQS